MVERRGSRLVRDCSISGLFSVDVRHRGGALRASRYPPLASFHFHSNYPNPMRSLCSTPSPSFCGPVFPPTGKECPQRPIYTLHSTATFAQPLSHSLSFTPFPKYKRSMIPSFFPQLQLFLPALSPLAMWTEGKNRNERKSASSRGRLLCVRIGVYRIRSSGQTC